MCAFVQTDVWQLTGLRVVMMMMMMMMMTMLATEQTIYNYLMFTGLCIIVITAE